MTGADLARSFREWMDANHPGWREALLAEHPGMESVEVEIGLKDGTVLRATVYAPPEKATEPPADPG